MQQPFAATITVLVYMMLIIWFFLQFFFACMFFWRIDSTSPHLLFNQNSC